MAIGKSIMSKINLESETLVECLLRRKGGTKVPFGRHGSNHTVYNFQPIDANDPESPHVADVPNEDHYERLLSIREGYRAYNHEDYEPTYQIPAANPEAQNFDSKNNMHDILSVDPNTVSNDWLAAFAKEVLELPPKTKSKIAEYALTTYEVELSPQLTANEMIREVLKLRIDEEKRSADAAANEE